jgi:hypothetical protein
MFLRNSCLSPCSEYAGPFLELGETRATSALQIPSTAIWRQFSSSARALHFAENDGSMIPWGPRETCRIVLIMNSL